MKSCVYVLMAVGLLAACSTPKKALAKADVVAHPVASDYFALVTGAVWNYEVELLGAKNTVEVKMGNENAEGYFEDSTGAAFLADSYGVRDHKRYLLRNPVAVGTTWTNVVSVSSIEHYQVLSTGEPCLTRGGSWQNCVTIESRNRVQTGRELVNEYTLAPGVGIVRLATVLESDGKRIPQSHLELVRFSRP